ncbi:ABC transporter permease [Gorillibacterium massiliense]|uniref:ABC transporter permease n=1 Tax=Gorillibacterium massiliense TaxID=1280390 RepID=UPI0004AD8926|nr:ABC transporter permease [Gorillibacterium massiliense]
MMGRLLAADFLKLKRTMVGVLVLLGPFGVVALTAVNFGLRYDYLTHLYKDDLWGGLLSNIADLCALALLLGNTLLTSMVAGIEHRANAWKQLLSLPVTRFHVFLSKFAVCVLLLVISSALLAVGTWLLGGFLGFGWSAPIQGILKISFYPMLASLAIAALQLWLSVVFKNQAIPLTAGIVGTIVGLYSFKLPDWLLWKWPIMLNGVDSPNWPVYAGITVGLLLLLISMVHFAGKDVD